MTTLTSLHTLTLEQLRELAMRDCSTYSSDDLAIAWELFDRLIEGGRIVEADRQQRDEVRKQAVDHELTTPERNSICVRIYPDDFHAIIEELDRRDTPYTFVVSGVSRERGTWLQLQSDSGEPHTSVELRPDGSWRVHHKVELP